MEDHRNITNDSQLPIETHSKGSSSYTQNYINFLLMLIFATPVLIVCFSRFFGKLKRFALQQLQQMLTKTRSKDKVGQTEEIEVEGKEIIYQMTSTIPGKVIIINIKKFYNSDGTIKRTRIGSEIDVKNLKRIFQKIGMEVDTQPTLTTKDKIEKYLNICSEEDYSAYNMLVLVVMSHGGQEKVQAEGHGEKIKLNKFVHAFQVNKSLQKKPKIYIFQCCRGKLRNTIPIPASHNLDDNCDSDETTQTTQLDDSVMIFSTIEDHVSYRFSTGSWYIDSLCEAFTQIGKSGEICQILTLANCFVRQREKQNKQNEIEKQTSEFTSHLTKSLFFNNSPDKMPITKVLESYNMDGLKPGKAIIIHINTSHDKPQTAIFKRNETASTINKLSYVLRQERKMDVEAFFVTSREEKRNILLKYADDNYINHATFMCIALMDDCVDTQNLMNEMVNLFDASSGLQGKPKIFLFYSSDACASYNGTNANERQKNESLTEPYLADSLVVIASAPAHNTSCDAKTLQCFLQQLCNAFEKYSNKEEICEFMTRLKRSNCTQRHTESQTFATCFTSRLSKNLYFPIEKVRFVDGENLESWIHCTKHSQHTDFISVPSFSLDHLPEPFKDADIVRAIVLLAGLTVKIQTFCASEARPDSHNGIPYPRYSPSQIVSRLGTGKIHSISVYPEDGEEHCRCKTCEKDQTITKAWGKVSILTAKHVVFDEVEAKSTRCFWAYDKENCTSKIFEGIGIRKTALEYDMCLFECATHQIGLLKSLKVTLESYTSLCSRVYEKFKHKPDKNLAIVVSHPHGWAKHVSIGKVVTKDKLENEDTRYTYDAHTCPGCSGAPVYVLEKKYGWWTTHLHSASITGGSISGRAWM
ncbi:uncharacterized protein LOC131950059 isoform X2 [Physella acuta]|uniref:uncharacterized protein LOC131950059 isoform X2 n=1 Tax=Physella acuta TaxID=109671 RepID=UPI0027DC389F|nr:uncharacterized protein LOC131950059 isoform X2 [Physella acuta]